MKLHVKVGTMPAEYADALRLRNAPQVGDFFWLKRDSKWQGLSKVMVKLDQIKDLGGDLLYFVSMV
jgi:hypothetical protein